MRRFLLLGLMVFVAGCVHRPSCENEARSSLAGLECRAWSGDAAAQLALGRLYEAGDGVPQDARRAARLYRSASQFQSGTTYVYSPPVGKHGRAMVLPIRTGVDRPGLAEARYRLGRLYLEGRGVRRDRAKGEKLVERARTQGFAGW